MPQSPLQTIKFTKARNGEVREIVREHPVKETKSEHIPPPLKIAPSPSLVHSLYAAAPHLQISACISTR